MNEREQLQQIVDRLATRGPLSVLEAGCGSASHIQLGANARVTGIDISEQQLARNGSLSERILGDIQTYPLAASSFDLVVCWDVLEHLPHPDQALSNLASALRDGGMIVLAFPDFNALKSLVTRLTPHSFHVWVYRHILGIKTAGRDDKGPFKTFFHPTMATDAIEQFARDHGLDVVSLVRYESTMQYEIVRARKLFRFAWEILTPVVKRLTNGRIDGDISDVIMVLQKRSRGASLQ